MYYRIKHAFQRMIRGYDDRDVYDFGSRFAERNAKILRQFKNNCVAQYRTDTKEKFESDLQEIIDCLENCDDERLYRKHKADLKINGAFTKMMDGINEERNKCMNRAFELLGEYLWNIWD